MYQWHIFGHLRTKEWCSYRGSGFGFYTTVNVQNGLQTQICAEEMQLCVWIFMYLFILKCCTWPSQKGLCWRLPVFSAFGRHLERHRGFPGERPQRHGPQRWAFRGSSRSCAVHYLLPAEQAHAHHASDKRGTVHQPAAQLPAGSLWPVSKRVTWRASCWLCTFTSEVLTWVDAVWNVTVKIQTPFPF